MPAERSAADAWYLSIQSEIREGFARLRVAGRLGTAGSAELRSVLLPLVRQGHTIQLDFSGVDYVSGAGFGVLTECGRLAAETGGAIEIDSVSEPVRLGFDLIGPIPGVSVRPTLSAE